MCKICHREYQKEWVKEKRKRLADSIPEPTERMSEYSQEEW